MNRPARRLLVLLPLALLTTAACTGAAATPPPTPAPAAPAAERPAATPSPVAPTPITHPSHPAQGDVGRTYPELSVELTGAGYLVGVVDPTAKAWRLDVRGTGEHAGDRLEIVVEVGDVAPGVEGRIHVDGELVDVVDMTGMVGLDDVAAGGCHPTLQLCFGSGGVRVDPAGVSVVFERIEEGAFVIEAGSADWPGEPFVLGPWRTSEPFPTS